VTDTQVHSLFAGYTTAFNALVADHVASLFDERSAIIDDQRTVVFANREELRDSLELLMSYYRSIGFVGAERARMDIAHLSETLAEVDVGWRMRLADGDAEFSTRYWLADRPEGPKVVAVLAYNEAQAWSAVASG